MSSVHPGSVGKVSSHNSHLNVLLLLIFQSSLLSYVHNELQRRDTICTICQRPRVLAIDRIDESLEFIHIGSVPDGLSLYQIKASMCVAPDDFKFPYLWVCDIVSPHMDFVFSFYPTQDGQH